ncbi:MAG: hypothetical protein M1348_02160 [Candidatus Parvarchaeota archaeon]|nr:hypothetical protein [Candidatus Parvarchaeota archaeon]
MKTTIQLDPRLKERMEKLKVYPNETYEKIIERLINISDEEGELSKETIKNIEISIKEIKEGKFYTTVEARKKLGLK